MTVVTEPTKVCAICEERKPWSHFYAKKRHPDGTMRQPHSYCKPCHKAYSNKRARARWHAKREWAEDRMRRARERGQDPEVHATRHQYKLEWDRRNRPERYKDGVPPELRGEIAEIEAYGRTPTAPIRAAVQEARVTPTELALRFGWLVGGAPDSSRVAKVLRRNEMMMSTALRFLAAIDVAPREVGL